MKKTITQATREFSKLVRAVEHGEAVVITRRGKPVAKMVRIQSEKPRPIGFLRGKVREIDPHWWHPMTDEEVDAFIGTSSDC